ncbi:MAG: hypothetical protein ACR2LJ_07040 [Acidimicrobiales bacterium]
MRLNTSIVSNVIAGVIAAVIFAVISLITGADADGGLVVRSLLLGLFTFVVAVIITQAIMAVRARQRT